LRKETIITRTISQYQSLKNIKSGIFNQFREKEEQERESDMFSEKV